MSLLIDLMDRGLVCVGPTDAPGTEGGVLVAHPNTARKVTRLDESIYRVTPVGPGHSLVRYREQAQA